MLEVIELKVGDKESIFELSWRRLQKILEPGFHLRKRIVMITIIMMMIIIFIKVMMIFKLWWGPTREHPDE